MSKQQNEKLIIGTLKEAQVLFKNQKLSDALQKLNSILPMVKRLNLREVETYTMLAVVTFRLNDFDAAYEYADSALKMQDNPNLWKIQLQVLVHKKDESKESRQKLIDRSIFILKNLKASDVYLQIISEFLKEEDFQDETELIDSFIKSLKQLPVKDAAKYVSIIPDEEEYTEYKVELFKAAIEQGIELTEDNYSDLCYALKDLGDYDACLYYLKYLPEDNTDRLFLVTLFGDDPVTTAQKHISKGKEQFIKWYEAIKANNYDEILTQINYIDLFLAGYLQFLSSDAPKELKSKAADTLVTKFSKTGKALFAAANTKFEINEYDSCISICDKLLPIHPQDAINLKIQSFLKTGRENEAEKIMDQATNLDTELRLFLDIKMYETDKDSSRLHRILQVDDDPKYVKYKAQAIYLLGEEIPNTQAMQLFAKQIKLDPTNGTAYLYFGKYMKTIMKDFVKSDQLFNKAMEFGAYDPDTVEVKTKTLINENQLDEALKLCKEVDTDWSHFRAGTILFRQNKFEECRRELQIHIKKKPKHAEAWIILGYAYLSLNCILSAITVIEELKKIKKPCPELEQRIKFIYGIPVFYGQSPNEKDFKLDETPLLFSSYLLQVIAKIKNFYIYGRIKTCKQLVVEITPLVNVYGEKWGSLTSVLKQCGDFFVQAFTVTGEKDNILSAQKYFMKRAENDKRGECFIDVAMTFHLRGETNNAIMILRRAVKAFPDNQQVWFNLGLAFAIVGRSSYARHCFCVAIKIADFDEQSEIFATLAFIALIMRDLDLCDKSAEMSAQLNPKNPTVWKLRSLYDQDSDQYSAAKLAYENGPDKTSVQKLLNICLRENKPEEALGYAFMLEDRNTVGLALEACQKYDDALDLAQDEPTKQRLNQLLRKQLYINPESDLIKAIDFYSKEMYDEAGQIFMQVNNMFSILGAAACTLKKGYSRKVASLVKKQIENNQNLPRDEQIVLDQVSIKADPQISPYFPGENHSIVVRLIAEYGIDIASLKAYLSRNKDHDIIRFFLSHNLKVTKGGPPENAQMYKSLLEAAQTYAATGTRESLFLEGLVYVKLNQPELALQNFQRLCVLSPAYIESLMVLMNQLQLGQQDNDDADDLPDECMDY